ncbi:hypothetical protein HEP84_55455 [Streptomyces sp. RLB1-33]|nr:hypothetical protein [Streptomyces sp. RLB1-33]
MEAEEFLLVRDMFRTFAARFRIGSADEVKPTARTAAQEALGELGLAELRRSSPPAATVQECALLAEEHGRQPLTTSLVGTVLLAPELLRLLDRAEPPPHGATPTIALADDLRFPGSAPGSSSSQLLAWDCEGGGQRTVCHTRRNGDRARTRRDRTGHRPPARHSLGVVRLDRTRPRPARRTRVPALAGLRARPGEQ